MNKRIVTLLSVCFVLAVASLTVRYIEQEKESIKARFVGQKPTQERSTTKVDSSRDLPRTAPLEQAIPPVKQETGLIPPANGMEQTPADSTPVVATSYRDRSGPPAGAPASTSPAAGKEKSVVSRTDIVPATPLSTPLDEVSTPLVAEEQAPAPVPESHGGDALNAQEVNATGVEEKNAPPAESEDAAEAPQPVAAEGEGGEQEVAEEGSVTEDNAGGEDEEVTGESEPSEGEEVAEEEELPQDGEVQQEKERAARLRRMLRDED